MDRSSRRAFFTGVAAAFSAKPNPPKSQPLVVTSNYCCAECGFCLLQHAGPYVASPRQTYFTCANPHCAQFDKPLAVPLLTVKPADPELVRRVRAYEKERYGV